MCDSSQVRRTSVVCLGKFPRFLLSRRGEAGVLMPLATVEGVELMALATEPSGEAGLEEAAAPG